MDPCYTFTHFIIKTSSIKTFYEILFGYIHIVLYCKGGDHTPIAVLVSV
jgi:hypothetical protein